MAGKKDKEPELDTFTTSAEAVEAPKKKADRDSKTGKLDGTLPPLTLDEVIERQNAGPCETCGGIGCFRLVANAGHGDELCPTCRGTGRAA